MRLVVGKANIENYENAERGLTVDSMDCAQPMFMWKDSQGVVQPAIIVWDADDFTGGGGESPSNLDGGTPSSSYNESIDGGTP
jgi:hypothetical protein